MIGRGCKSFIKLLSLVLISLVLSSCEEGCTEAYEFESENVTLESFPQDDGVYGDYNHEVGGQIANHTNSGLRINGKEIVLKITGAWSPWEEIDSDAELDATQACDICFKKDVSQNCICKDGESPAAEEFDMDGVPTNNPDCTDTANQNDPNLCTCTQQYGTVSDLDTYFIALNPHKKDESALNPDLQELCKFTAGAGAYIGLFGGDGVTFPLRQYHLFTTDEVCDVARDSDGNCVDDEGEDITQYIYKSPNGKTFIKDDKSGNNGSDINPDDDEYHVAGEVIKLIINDRYYSDNYGRYKINFVGGVLKEEGEGIFEYIVGTVEDFVIGKMTIVTGSDGTAEYKREGGALEFLYNTLVQDSTFIVVVQMSLILYVTFFGIGVLMGTVDISRKEVSSRVIKIALIIFFTMPTSWYWYNELVVGFFKDGMDALVAMFMDIVDENIDDTSLIIAAQGDRSESAAVSQATRFSYIDYVAAKMLAPPTHRKIWGLLFGTAFGFIYIPCIYALIIFFLYTALTAALIYVTALLKMVLVLGLGPLFIIASLFNRTEAYFKKWISFLAARSLEIVVLFLILYTFLVLIDVAFTDLLWFKVCKKSFYLGLFTLDVLELKDSNRGFVDWMTLILGVAALIFLLKTVMAKIPAMVNDLISISGTGSRAGDATGLANDAMKGLFGAMKSAATNTVPSILRGMKEAGGEVARVSGLSDSYTNLKNKSPIRNPISIMRDRKIDAAIKSATASGKARNMKGAELARHIRSETASTLAKQAAGSDKNSAAFLGIDSDAITNRLDKTLVRDPLKKFLKKEAQNLRKNTNQYGKEMRDTLKARAEEWADNNLHVGKDGIQRHLSNMKGLLNSQSQLSAKDATKKFAGNAEAQNQYLNHLNSNVAQRAQKASSSGYFGVGNKASRLGSYIKSNTVGRIKSKLGMRDNYTPDMAKSKFLEELAKQRRRDHYKKQEASNIADKTWSKDFGTKLANKMGFNTSKSMSQRFERFDKDKLKQTKLDGQKERNSLRREAGQESLGKNIADRMKDISDNHQAQLKKYGYDKDAKAGHYIPGAPSKAQLQKEARDQLDALAKRMALVKTPSNTDGMAYSLNINKTSDKIKNEAQKKIDANNKRLAKLKKSLEKSTNPIKSKNKVKKMNKLEKENNSLNKKIKDADNQAVRDQQKLDIAVTSTELDAMRSHFETAKREISQDGVIKKSIDNLLKSKDQNDDGKVKKGLREGAELDEDKELKDNKVARDRDGAYEAPEFDDDEVEKIVPDWMYENDNEESKGVKKSKLDKDDDELEVDDDSDDEKSKEKVSRDKEGTYDKKDGLDVDLEKSKLKEEVDLEEDLSGDLELDAVDLHEINEKDKADRIKAEKERLDKEKKDKDSKDEADEDLREREEKEKEKIKEEQKKDAADRSRKTKISGLQTELASSKTKLAKYEKEGDIEGMERMQAKVDALQLQIDTLKSK